MSSNVVVEEIGNLQFSVVISWICGIVALIIVAVFCIMRAYRWIEKYRKNRNYLDKNHETFEELKKSEEETKKQLNGIEFALQRILADRLNEQIKRFYHTGYIPFEDFSTFQSNFKAYEGVGGNGEMHEKYQKCIDDLDCR